VTKADPTAPDAGSSGSFAAEEVPFIDRFRSSIEERRADGRSLALLLVDCGLIGRIDALWGFQIGDAVRARIIASLRADALRADDFVGALGRDNLACVLSSVESPQIALLAAQKVLRTVNAPLWLGEEEIFASPSIGIALFLGRAGNAESMMRQAKIACVTARGGIGHVALYNEAQDSALSGLVQASRLRAAIAEDALELVFQPQFDLRFGQIMGVESMLRSSGANGNLVAMREAFAAAEAGGLVPKFLSSIFNRALRNCSEFRQRAGLDLRIAVNLPGRALLVPELAEMVERALGTWALRAGRLVLEIGDITLLEEYPQARAMITQLDKIGVKLSIDDPHAPVSALFWLTSLPFNELKIDFNQVSDWMGDARTEGVLKSLIDLAHQMKLDVAAIGVQSDAAAARLAELGCDFMQADFKGSPVDPEEFVARFAS